MFRSIGIEQNWHLQKTIHHCGRCGIEGAHRPGERVCVACEARSVVASRRLLAQPLAGQRREPQGELLA
jgi:hypothetical protein